MVRALAHRRWERVDGRLIDKRFVKNEYLTNDGIASSVYTVDEYMVEVTVASGAPVRLLIEEKSYSPSVSKLLIGEEVALLVNPKRTEAVFDDEDPRIESKASRKVGEEKLRTEGEARFKAKLEGADDGAPSLRAISAEKEALQRVEDSRDDLAALAAMEAAEEASEAADRRAE
ncbi:hypothetical protein BH10ACT11_BH10ACT11_07080 [soil metagenome]